MEMKYPAEIQQLLDSGCKWILLVHKFGKKNRTQALSLRTKQGLDLLRVAIESGLYEFDVSCSDGMLRLITQPKYNHAAKKYFPYINSAIERNLTFNLNLMYFCQLISAACHYCGSKTQLNGIDRKDNTLGYISGNVLPCCKICNRAKSSMAYDDFIDYLDRLSTNRANNLIPEIPKAIFKEDFDASKWTLGGF